MNSDPHFSHNVIMLYLALGKHQVKFLRLNIICIRYYGILLCFRTYLKNRFSSTYFQYLGCCVLLSRFSYVQFFTNPWTIAHPAPLSLGFTRPEYWSGLPCSAPGDLPDPGIEPASLLSSALASRILFTSATWEAHTLYIKVYVSIAFSTSSGKIITFNILTSSICNAFTTQSFRVYSKGNKHYNVYGQDPESKWIKILDPSLTVLGALQTYVMTLILRPWLGSEWKNWLH